ncbi:MAG: hypothetical protein WKF89_18550 [Chitinophagaceae bacterium]
MKIRILNNHLRFRLKQLEVERFMQEGRVIEVLEFGQETAAQLSFCLEIYQEESLSVRFISNVTTIFVPQGIAESWTSSERVGFDGKINTGLGRTIEILVEKDFQCLDGREEENEGSYPNPKISQ